MTHVGKILFQNIHLYQQNPIDTAQYLFYPGVPRCALDASHLCHNKQCLNPWHIIFEPHRINLKRNACRLFKEMMLRDKQTRIRLVDPTTGRNTHQCTCDHKYGSVPLPNCFAFSDHWRYSGVEYDLTRFGRAKIKEGINQFSQIRPPPLHLVTPGLFDPRGYYQREDVKQRQREYQQEYRQREDVKQRQREYQQEYRQREDVKQRRREYDENYRRRKKQGEK